MFFDDLTSQPMRLLLSFEGEKADIVPMRRWPMERRGWVKSYDHLTGKPVFRGSLAEVQLTLGSPTTFFSLAAPATVEAESKMMFAS